jgi:hypothetical protein
MKTVADIFRAWPSDADLGRDIGVPYSTVAAWKRRGSIPATHWQAIIRAAEKRGRRDVTADLLVELHAGPDSAMPAGFGERDTPFADQADEVESAPDGSGHFSRFRHLRRHRFKTAEEIEDHIRALREEWSHR